MVGGDEDGRPVVALHEARGHDPEHAGVPAVRPEHDGRRKIGTQRLKLVERFLQGGLVDLLPHGVVFLEALRDRHRLARIGGEEKAHAALGVSEPSGGVDAWRQDVGHVPALDPVGPQAGHFFQGDDAGLRRVADTVEPELGDDAVLAAERDYIRDGSERDQIQMFVDEARGQGSRTVLGQPLDELEHDPDPRQLLERVGAIPPLRVQDGVRFGKDPQRLVMVRHDHVDAVLLGQLDLGGRGDAAVRGDDETDAPLLGDVHAPDREAVSVPNPIRDEIGDLGPQVHEGGGQEAGGRDSIDVVVPVDQDGLTLVDGFPDARRGKVHITHRECVQQLVQVWLEEALNVAGRGEAPVGQQGGVRVRNSQLNGKLLGVLRGSRTPEHPGLGRGCAQLEAFCKGQGRGTIAYKPNILKFRVSTAAARGDIRPTGSAPSP